MGYSARKEALNRLNKVLESGGNGVANGWYDDEGNEYFEERGRENPDGSYTARVYRLKDMLATPVGGIRIEPNGYVTRFPYMNKAMKVAAKAPLEEEKPPFMIVW